MPYYFPQNHPPAQRGLSDFTDARDLTVTIDGQPFDHRLYHFRLACSGWEHGEVVLGGESFTALAEGLQNALWRLGGVPDEHRTDSLSAAFRNLTRDQKEDLTRRYEDLCRHYGMTPTRNNPGEAHENGTVEAAHGHLKRRIDQALKRRGSRDFDTIVDYRLFVAALIDRHNKRRHTQVAVEAALLKPLPERRSTDFIESTAPVTRNGTIAVDKVNYSVPSRLVGQRLKVHLYDDRLLAYLGPTLVFEADRVRPTGKQRAHVVNYRHVIDTLRRKPQAFRNYVFRDHLFPHDAYRRAWHAIDAALPPREACRTMVGLLDLAANHACEGTLADHLTTILDAGEMPDLTAIRAIFAPEEGDKAASVIDTVTVRAPNLADYDQLLGMFGAGVPNTASAEARS